MRSRIGSRFFDKALNGVLELVDPRQRLQQSKYLAFLSHYFKLDKAQGKIYRGYKQQKQEGEIMDTLISTIFKEEGKIEMGRDLLMQLFPLETGANAARARKSHS